MGGSQSTEKPVNMDKAVVQDSIEQSDDSQFVKDAHMQAETPSPLLEALPPITPLTEAPPVMRRVASPEDKMWEKFTKQPLVPLGCAATAYFLVSGIKSFSKQDPRRAQKMMRARVGAQFATLAIFAYYVGFESINFDIAPAYYRAKEEEEAMKAKGDHQ